MTREQIKNVAMKLEPADREILADELYYSLSGLDQSAIDAAWLAEAKRRYAEHLLHPEYAVPVDAAIQAILAGQKP